MLSEPETALMAFGFNQIESMVYAELLRQAPATGYKLAQRVGRAPANVYQALKALHQKGAILIESNALDTTSYVPVPPPQLFASLRYGFQERADAALNTLSQVHQPPQQETLSQLRTVSQIIERLRSMLCKARETVVFDAVPDLYDLLLPDIDATRKRGLDVAGIAYRGRDVLPTMPLKIEPEGAVQARWPGLGIILVTDANEQIVAQISKDMTQVLNSIYSDSVFLCSIMHGMLLSDIRLIALAAEMQSDPPAITAFDSLDLHKSHPPGLRKLLGED